MIDVLVVGAGLSGLTAAVQCQTGALKVLVVEASAQIGGRVQSAVNQGSYVGDLGPSWVWPQWQPLASRWLAELQVTTFAQYDDGLGLLDHPGRCERHSLPGQYGIQRVTGGPQAIVSALATRLRQGTVHCDALVQKLQQQSGYIDAHIRYNRSGAGAKSSTVEVDVVSARQVILAAPLRSALETIQFEPELPDEIVKLMAETPTWMAAQVKVVAQYPTPFWRDDGLSGRVASRVGPLVEIHDHCSEPGEPAALFGFMGLDFEQRRRHRDALRELTIEQLTRCFGARAANPLQLWIEDWALVHTICSDADRSGPAQHAVVRPDSLRQPLMGQKLHLAVAEVATESPGLIEGALHAGEVAARSVVDKAG